VYLSIEGLTYKNSLVMIMNRRHFLASSISAALSLTGCSSDNSIEKNTSDLGNNLSYGNTNKIKQSFFIPPELTGTMINGRLNYNLNLQEGVSQFIDNLSTPTWGINGNFLGPTIRLKNGSDVNLNFTNNLTETTTMHGHGMHLPAKMDGGIHQPITPGSTWTSSYTVNQHACTNWYHPHLMEKTAEHVIHGLAGLIIIDDADSEALDLPKRYGIDDIPVIVQDRNFNPDGSFDYSPTMREKTRGWFADNFLVNGVIDSVLNVEAKQVRFRLLNGSNSRVYNFAFASGKAFKQIATDNSFLEAPVTLTELRLSPAERAEIVVDFSNDIGAQEILKDLSSGIDLFTVNINRISNVYTTLPNQLVTLDKFDPMDAVNIRSFTLSGGMGVMRINGVTMDPDVINETVPINAIEIWEVTNVMNMVHNFHIHATHFLILERNGSALNVAENEKAYKDTVYLGPNESVKFIVKMVDYADDTNTYMYHCHILEHEDIGMMGQFVVV